MQIKISQLKKQVFDYLLNIGMNDHDATVFTELVVEQEMIGNQFSALAGLVGKHSGLDKLEHNQEEVVVDKPALRLIKGNGRLAPLITADHLDHVVEKAKSQGIYAVI
jgi:LDH2 family malate/lactate/ureidoglycolate dehydrogenase